MHDNLPDKKPEQSAASKRAKTSKRKGHNAERDLAQAFRDIGFDKACTTRASSRLLDACGIDLNYVPVIIQSKAGKQSSLNPMTELKSIAEKMHNNLPFDDPWHDKVKAVVQILPCATRKRSEYDDKVTMTLSDFLKLVKKAYPQNEKSRDTSIL